MNNFTHDNITKRYNSFDYVLNQTYNSKVFIVDFEYDYSNKNDILICDGYIYSKKYCLDTSIYGFLKNLTTLRKMLNKGEQNIKFVVCLTLKESKIEIYEKLLKFKDIIGILFKLESNFIDNNSMKFLNTLNKKTSLMIELKFSEKDTEIIKEFQKRQIKTIINFTIDQKNFLNDKITNQIKLINKLPISGINFSSLNITDINKYVEIICNYLEHLKPNIIIQKFTSDQNILPIVTEKVEKELSKRKTYQGFNLSILNKVKQIMEIHIKDKDIVIDATIGNGYDTLYMAKLIPNGFIFGFDIQKKAIDKTAELLNSNSITNYRLFLEDHGNMKKILKDYVRKIKLINFNLGYLPGGDKNITTNYNSTIKAINASLSLLKENGIILLTIYPGHEAGYKEKIEIEKYLKKLKQYKINYFYNTNNDKAPYLITINKR